ncbi:MAG: hypothetical protein AAFO94_17895, partial [Bacteroidota bacterium]
YVNRLLENMLHKEPEYKQPASKLQSKKDSSLLAGLESTSEKKKGVQLCCPDCDTVVPADNIHLPGAVAKCNSCNTVFPIGDELEHMKAVTTADKMDEIEILDSDNELHMRCNLQKINKNPGLPIVSGIYMGISFAGLIALVVNTAPFAVTSVVGLVAAVLSVAFTASLAHWRNKTYISVTDQQLSIESIGIHSPFYNPDKFIKRNRIESVYLKSRFSSIANKVASYDLIMKDHRGEETRLIKGMLRKEQGEFLVARINHQLKKQSSAGVLPLAKLGDDSFV